MIISSWNIRGLNDPIKQQEIKGYLIKNKVEVFGLLETRVKINNSAAIIRNFPFYSVINNYSHHYNGRIWVFLDTRKITLLNSRFHDHLIHLPLPHHSSNPVIYVTMIYGSNDGSHRDRLWEELRSVAGTVTNWIVLGDFNIVRGLEERIGPNHPSITEIMAFNQCLLDISLDDAHNFGLEHTWTNKREPTARIWSRLDRVLLNSDWLIQFPTTNVQVLPSGISDHSPLLVEVTNGYKIRRQFSYFNYWEDHKDYRASVTAAWDVSVKGNHIFKLFTKLKNVRSNLISLHKNHYTGISQKVIVARKDLETSQRMLHDSPLDPVLLEQEKGLLARYLILRNTERSCLLQRAKIQDIKFKDAPTSYFFSRIAARKHAVKDFFRKGVMPKQANTTMLALIPKKSVVSTVMDYRPIACCIVFYKPISKIICSRLKTVLPGIIGKEQGAFVKGRSIFEKIMLTQSLMLQVYKFPPQFQKWIMDCVTSTWFSIKVNGDTTGFFKGECGLRQGEPLSPFLFVMSMEILSRLLRKIHRHHQVSFHPKCGKLNLNHLIFADDLMLFVREDVPSVQAVTKTLNLFASLSGLQANPDKTNIYMGGVREEVKQAILRATQYVEGEFPFRYLGVPLNEGKLNKGMFADLLSKVQKCLHNWANQKISYAGKISLINIVIFGLEQFWCFTLLIPKGVIKLITKFCRHFLWGSDEGHRKLIMKSWASCCVPHAEGGFNIKETYNIKSGDFWTMAPKNFHSESCKSLLKVRNELVAKIGGVATARAFLLDCIAEGKLQLHRVYDFLRDPGRRISWARVVWNKAALPKHSFLVVLVMQRKLATIDQVMHRGMHLVNRCVLCKAANEDHAHLFFQCSYSSNIWQNLLEWMGMRGRSMKLKTELHWLANRRHRKHWKALRISSCLNALTHSLGEERNSRIFNNLEHEAAYIIRRVQFLVSVKLLHVTPPSYEEEILCSLNN
ncbi:uncharacterized protein LOC141601526 [Silene latifolia]|uniref:uncharacterized protein LOC141601526 n=1 Tax=Silene latifolia TaxID=37657 RepID=UPI003D7719B5